jgi:uncharacterized protein YjbI with pentapeptide repeats
MELMTFFLGKSQLRFLWTKLSEIREKRKAELQVLSDGFCDPFELARSYVEPDCQQFSPADDNEDDGTATIRTPLLAHIAKHITDRRANSARHMFVLSDAGMGKTSVLVMLKLAHLTSFWPADYNCVLLKLGVDTLSSIRQISDQSNTVLLLDALDEDPIAWEGVEARTEELLKATQRFRRVIITCRSQFLFPDRPLALTRGRFEISGFDCPVAYNSLFSDDQCLEYLEQRASQHRDDPKWLDKAKAVAVRMGTLRHRPMLLAHIEDLIDESALNWTEYEIYSLLVRNWLKRERQKVIDTGLAQPTVDELLLACRHVAVNMHQQKLRFSTAAEIENLMLKVPQVGHIERMHLMGRSLLNRDSHRRYRFSHYSIQEYLVISHALESEDASRTTKLLFHASGFLNKLFASWRSKASTNDFDRIQLNRLVLHGAHFQNESLSRVNLSKVDLSRSKFVNVDATSINFLEANLEEAEFQSTILDGASLSGANLQSAYLDGCSLQSANLQSANMDSASLRGTNLSNANLDGANLRGCNLSRAILDGCSLVDAVYDTFTIWPNGVEPLARGAVMSGRKQGG